MLVPSSDTIANGTTFAKTTQLYQSLQPLSERINHIIKLAEPQFYEALVKLREVSSSKHATLATYNNLDPLLMEGRELLFNRKSGRHIDLQDPVLGYAGLLSLGNFDRGGSLYLHQLNLKVSLLPGDFVLIRGRVLEHEIEDWDGGQRISIPHFTHTSLWRDCGLAHLVAI